jgi:hypothetical protein
MERKIYENQEYNGNEEEEAGQENPIPSCFGCEFDIHSGSICWGKSPF